MNDAFFETQARNYSKELFQIVEEEHDIIEEVFRCFYQKQLKATYEYLRDSVYIPHYRPFKSPANKKKGTRITIENIVISSLRDFDLSQSHQIGYFSLFPYTDYMINSPKETPDKTVVFVGDDGIDKNVEYQIPVLRIENAVWMSCSPLEVESQIAALMAATGSVVIGGLGMGVAAINIAMKPDVTSVLVIELSQDVHKAFMKSCYPELPPEIKKVFDKKVEFFFADITEMPLPVKEVDFLYVDIWEKVGDSNCIPDMIKILTLNKNISIQSIYWWGMEYDIVEFCSQSEKVMASLMNKNPVANKFHESQRLAVERFFSFFNDPAYKNLRINLDVDNLPQSFVNTLYVSTPICLQAFTNYIRRKSGKMDFHLLCPWEERYVHGLGTFHPMIHEYMKLLALWIITTKVVLCHSLDLETIFSETREGLM